MLDNVFTEEANNSKREVVLPAISDNIMNRTCEKPGSFKKTRNCKETYTYNQNETADIFRI